MNVIPSLLGLHPGLGSAVSPWSCVTELCTVWPWLWAAPFSYAFGSAQLAVLLCGALYLFRMRRRAAALQHVYTEEAARQAWLAHLERERSRILEAVSSALPLDQILTLLVNFLSVELNGALCWFLPARSSRICSANVSPEEGPKLDLPHLSLEIRAENGEWLGVFVVDTPPVSGTTPEQERIFEIVGSLATLAIENRRTHEDLVRRSEHDALTGLANRALFERRAAQALTTAERHSQGFALVYIDLDQFKKINDRHGHRVGDLYLQAIAHRLNERLRCRDTLARVGGDEFLAIINQVTHRSEVIEVVHRFADCFAAPFHIHEVTLIGSASFGIAVYPEDGHSIQELQAAADAAMYADKRMGYRSHEHIEAPPDLLRHGPLPPVSSGALEA